MAQNTRQMFTLAAIAGSVCAGALVLTSNLTRNGWAMLLPYIVLGLIAVVYLRSRRIEPFAQRFFLPFVAYVVATLLIDVYLVVVVNPHRTWTFWKYFGPLGVMLLIGAAASSLVALVARSSRADDALSHGRVR
jgi:hypothetical protein